MSQPRTTQDFCVRRDDLHQVSWTPARDNPEHTLAAGEVLLRIDRFGLSANNITYALLGELAQYWRFFPAPEGLGRMSVWGYADVVASSVPELPEGERFYGYLPISQYLIVRPDHINASTFRDASEHRRALPGTYQQYFRSRRGDPDEDVRMVLRPLFGTGFLIDDWLSDNSWFGAKRILIASASSKTAVATAFSLAQRAQRGFEIVALTSAANRKFCEQLGYYDRVVEYAQVPSLAPDVPSVFVDMAGDANVTRAVHTHLGKALAYSCLVGLTHQGSLAPTADLPGPKPQLFFAPDRIKQRAADWGPEGFRERVDTAQSQFFTAARQWLQIEQASGNEAIERTYRAVLDGKVGPAQGFILTF